MGRHRGDDAWPCDQEYVCYALGGTTDDGDRARLIENVSKGFSEDELRSLLLLAPYRCSTWVLVDKLGDSVRRKYWSDVVHNGIHGHHPIVVLLAGRWQH